MELINLAQTIFLLVLSGAMAKAFAVLELSWNKKYKSLYLVHSKKKNGVDKSVSNDFSLGLVKSYEQGFWGFGGFLRQKQKYNALYLAYSKKKTMELINLAQTIFFLVLSGAMRKAFAVFGLSWNKKIQTIIFGTLKKKIELINVSQTIFLLVLSGAMSKAFVVWGLSWDKKIQIMIFGTLKKKYG